MNDAASSTEKWLKYGAVAMGSLVSILQWQGVYQQDDSKLLITNVLVFVAIGSLLWEKGRSFQVNSGWISSLLGATLILVVLMRSLTPAGYQPQISLFLSGTGLCLLVSGWPGLKQFWREVTIAGLLIIDPVLTALLQVINLPRITTHISTAALSLLGFNPEQQGLFILLPTGRIEVYGACSGIDSIVQMINLAVVLALILPAKQWVKVVGFGLAPILGFSVNSLRIALLTFLVSKANMTAFHYWHDNPNASSVFFLISATLLLSFYYGCLQYLKGRNE